MSSSSNKERSTAATTTSSSRHEENGGLVLEFTLADSPVRIKMSDHMTVYALMDQLCQRATIGDGEGVDDHLWEIYVKQQKKTIKIESAPFGPPMDDGSLVAQTTTLRELKLKKNTVLNLHYDMGSTSEYNITVVKVSSNLNVNSSSSSPAKRPCTFHPYQAPGGVDLDASRK